MRILLRVAVTGKMLTTGNHSTVAQPLDPLRAEPTNFLRVRCERAVPNDRIVWIRVDIEHGSKIQIDSHCGEFSSGYTCGLVSERGVAGCTEASRGWKMGEWLGKPMNSSAFL